MFLVIAADKVKVISVGRKGQAIITRPSGGDHLRVAGRWNVPQPQRLQTVFIPHVQQVLSIRRYRRECYVAVVCEIFDRELFERNMPRLQNERVDAEYRSRKQNRDPAGGQARS